MKCPYCNSSLNTTANGPVGRYFELEIYAFKCLECHSPFAFSKYNKKYFSVPIIESFSTFPERVQKLSPKAYKLYLDCLKARAVQLDEFAGMGLRKALEWLTWNYLITVRQIPEKEILNTTLANRIEKMNGTFYTNVCAKIIRVYGNDVVHIQRKIPALNIEDAFDSFESLCLLIDNELSILEINKKFLK